MYFTRNFQNFPENPIEAALSGENHSSAEFIEAINFLCKTTGVEIELVESLYPDNPAPSLQCDRATLFPIQIVYTWQSVFPG